MVANIETFANGQSTFASRTEPAWHGLGTVFEGELNTQQMLDASLLSNWNVRLEEVTFPEGYQSHKQYFSTVRTNPVDPDQNDVLGVVGARYKVLQNEELFDFGDFLLDGGRWETAGSIAHGTKVFGSLALDRETVLDPNGLSDRINNYLLVSSSHDGSSSINIAITPVRVVCQNTLSIALANAKQTFKVRHTQTLQGRLQTAREALGIADRYLDAFTLEAQRLIETSITQRQFETIVELAYNKPEEDVKGSFAKYDTKVDLVNFLYQRDPANGNAWGAFNALEEQLDWYRTARGNDGESLLADASGFNPLINNKKNDLLSIVKQVAFA
jgi:phage/plasmid-like protein (TIGR03299 family)